MVRKRNGGILRRWIAGVLAVGLLSLFGCVPGAVMPAITGTPEPTGILIEYQISTAVIRSDAAPDESKQLFASIGSLGEVVYDPDLHRVTCDTTVGNTLVQIWIFLSPDEDIIDYVKVRRIMPLWAGAWMRYDFLESYSVASATIEFDRMDGSNKVFRIDGSTFWGFCDSIQTVEWREWRPDPPYSEDWYTAFYRLKDPYSTLYHDCEDASNFVEITLEYD